jgi:hypothetical protein
MVRRRERCELSRYASDSLRLLGCIQRAVRPMKTEDRRVCPSCGNKFSGAAEFCPVCMLHGALADEVESGESSSERVIKPKSQDVARRFQHYEVVVSEDGRRVELGRGAMGVTYKAFDIDLRCPVTLKVISEKYLGDDRRAFVSCAKHAQRLASGTRMLPRSSTWGEALRVTSTPWSL